MPFHLHATPDDVAPFVLLPGDPGRARYIAETYLDDAQLYNDNRGLLGFTGFYRGLRVSVQTTGMGCPSASIVLEELIQLGAKTVLRIGTCGGVSRRVGAGELVIAQAALAFDGTTRQYLAQAFGGAAPLSDGGGHVPLPAWRLLRASERVALELGVAHSVGLVASEDSFYAPDAGHIDRLEKRGVLGIDMESSAIFTVATLRGIEAGALVTYSNRIGEPLIDPAALKAGVDAMIQVALDTLVVLGGE
jgi:purine-nucleoside phosphorylase